MISLVACISSRSSCHFFVVEKHHVPEPNCRAVTVPRRCNTPPARRKNALEQNCPPLPAECFLSPVRSPLPFPAYRCRRSPLARGAPVFLDPASHFAAAKLLPTAVRVSHSPIRLPKAANDARLTPSDPANDRLTCVPVGKSAALSFATPGHALPSVVVPAAGGGSPFPLHASHRVWKTSSCGGMKLSLTSPSGNHSDSTPTF